MYPIVEIINYIFAAILIGVSGAWIILIKSMLISFRDTPYLDKFNSKDHINPKVSVIVPARNEEKLISKCLDSLLNQDYQNYEIVVIDDSSEDSTGQIIKKYAEKHSKIIHVSARPKPEDWMGKNWACMEGYKLKMVRGEHLLEAVWASNWSTLWNGLKRLMVPLYLQNNTIAIGIFFAVLFLLFMPFPILFYSVVFFNGTISFTILLISSILACCLVYFAGIIDATKGLQIKWIYSLLAPVGSFIVVAGFLMGMLQAKSKTAISWRGRRYSMKEHVTNSISV